MNKILIIATFLLFNIILVEAGVYFFYKPAQSLSQSLKCPAVPTTATVSKWDNASQKSIGWLKKFVTDHKASFPLFWDEEKEKMYINSHPNNLARRFHDMAVDFSQIGAMTTWNKDQTEILQLRTVIKGTIKKLVKDKLRESDGKTYAINFILVGKNRTESEFWEEEKVLKTVKLYGTIDGKEVLMKYQDWIDELKDGDEITFDSMVDLTKSVQDASAYVGTKVIKSGKL